METLSEQLERLQKAISERDEKAGTYPVLSGGLMEDAGKTKLPELEEVLPPEMMICSPSVPKTLSQAVGLVLENAASGMLKQNSSPQNIGQKHSASDKERLALVLGKICQLQRLYGKTEGELKVLVEGFCWILPDYTMDAIINSIQLHVRKNNNIPTPADIENILNPPLPKPDWPAYVALKKSVHDGVYLMPDEREFLRSCEAYAKIHHEQEMDNYRTAQRDIELYKRVVG